MSTLWSRRRDALVLIASALTLFGFGISAALHPSWHRGQFFGAGFEAVMAGAFAFIVGVTLAAILAAPPAGWHNLERMVRRGSLAVLALAPLAMFAFRLVRGLSLEPYTYNPCTDGWSSPDVPSHVAVLAMFVFPVAGFNLGLGLARGLAGGLWSHLSTPEQGVVRRAGIVLAGLVVVGFVSLCLLVASWPSALLVIAGCALAPLLVRDWRGAAISVLSLACATLFTLYL